MFLDANIFLCSIFTRSKEGEDCRNLLKRIARGEQNAAISPLVMDEAMHVLIPKRGLGFAIRFMRSILENPGIKVLAVEERVLNRLPTYLEQGMEPRDAMHAATMRVYSISTICTFDRGFDNKKGIKRQGPK